MTFHKPRLTLGVKWLVPAWAPCRSAPRPGLWGRQAVLCPPPAPVSRLLLAQATFPWLL